MEKIAFTMRLKPGQAAKYERRHDAIWPELVELLRTAGSRDYSIFLDESTRTLFAVLWREDGHRIDRLPEEPVMRRWWSHMADIVETNPDGSPVTTPLRRVFHLD